MSVRNQDDVVSKESTCKQEGTEKTEIPATSDEQQRKSLTDEEKRRRASEANRRMALACDKYKRKSQGGQSEESKDIPDSHRDNEKDKIMMEKAEAERKENERKEAERREAERKEAERIEAERKEEAKREAQRREAQRKEAARRAAESQRSCVVISDEEDEEPAILPSGRGITSILRASYAPIHLASNAPRNQTTARSSIFEYPQYSDYRKMDEEKQNEDTIKEDVTGEEDEEMKRHIASLPNDQLPIYSYEVLIVVLSS